MNKEAFVEMGVLVKTAQRVERRVELTRRQFAPKCRLRLREARAEWLELKRRSRKVSAIGGTEIRLRASLGRADARLRMMVAKLIGRIIVELEKVRQTLPRG